MLWTALSNVTNGPTQITAHLEGPNLTVASWALTPAEDLPTYEQDVDGTIATFCLETDGLSGTMISASFSAPGWTFAPASVPVELGCSIVPI